MSSDSVIEQRNDGYYIQDTRVSLESVVYAFLDGLSPESIQADCFPVLTLAQVYNAIAYYLNHRDELEVYLADEARGYESFRAETRARHPQLARRLDALRQNAGVPSA